MARKVTAGVAVVVLGACAPSGEVELDVTNASEDRIEMFVVHFADTVFEGSVIDKDQTLSFRFKYHGDGPVIIEFMPESEPMQTYEVESYVAGQNQYNCRVTISDSAPSGECGFSEQ